MVLNNNKQATHKYIPLKSYYITFNYNFFSGKNEYHKTNYYYYYVAHLQWDVITIISSSVSRGIKMTLQLQCTRHVHIKHYQSNWLVLWFVFLCISYEWRLRKSDIFYLHYWVHSPVVFEEQKYIYINIFKYI